MAENQTTGTVASPGTCDPSGDEILTRFEVAAALQVSLRTVDRMIACGELPVLRVRDKVVRFLRADVERYIKEQSR